MIINTLDFFITSEARVPNVGTSSPADTGNQGLLQWYIDTYEPRVLINGLGRELYDLFVAQFNVDRTSPTYGDLLGGAPARFVDLLNGTTYTLNGRDFYWNGLRFRQDPSTDPPAALRSLIVYYVYYKYVEGNVDNFTDLGVAIEAVKNANIVDPKRLMVFVWREFIRLYGGDHIGHRGRRFGHYQNGFWVRDFSMVNNTSEVSLWQFLTDNSDIYPEWRFTPFENINQFGV